MRYFISRYAGLSIPLFLCSLLPGQPAQCTQDTVVGTYATAAQGVMLVPSSTGGQAAAVPAASLAILSIDSQGRMSGKGYGAMGGGVGQVPGGGSFQVNADCTAIVKTDVGTTTLDTILDEGRELRGLMLQAPGGTPMIQGGGRRISRIPNTVAPAQCSAADVHGIYAFTHQGTYIMPQPGAPQPVPVTALMNGLVSIDYQGQVTGSGKAMIGGNALDFTVGSGQVKVNSDCSATAHMTVQAAPLTDEGDIWMVALEGGGELWTIQTSSTMAKPVVTGTWKRISPIPATGGSSSGGTAANAAGVYERQ